MNHSSAAVILALLLFGPLWTLAAGQAHRIGSGAWAKIGVPTGLVMPGIYFAVIKLLG